MPPVRPGMTDQNSEDSKKVEHEENESGGEEYEIERLLTREEGAVALRRLADGVATGSVELGDDAVTVGVPDRFELALEYEQEAEEAELEVELKWPIGNGEAVMAQDGVDAVDPDTGERSERGGDGAERDAVEGAQEFGKEDDFATEADASGPIAEVEGAGAAASSATFELYRDRADEWRWRLVHDNGNVIADSGEGYDRIASARNGLESVKRNAPGATVDEPDD